MNKKPVIVIGKSDLVGEVINGHSPHQIKHGECKTKTWNYFQHPSGNLDIGIWSCEAGEFHVPAQPNNELCTILEGGAKVVDGNGNVNEFKPGDTFIMRYGMESTWTIDDYVKKIFVVVKNID
jgi:uncharacterized cupin superfamily protein